jgi:oxygen-dependent protoporphyrinogen oxidase
VRSGAPTLVEACRAQRAAIADHTAPVFFAPRGGMGSLVAALVSDLDALGVTITPGRAVTVERQGATWQVTIDGDRATELHDGAASAIAPARSLVAVDGVVISAPAPTAAELVRSVAPRAATLLAAVPYASVALLSLAVPREGIDRELDASGFLVPRVEDRVLTACSWTSSKWPHLAGDRTVWLRASAGRDGDEGALHLDDAALTASVVADLRDTMQLRGDPIDVRVTRWLDSLPQYRPGHLDRVDAIDDDLASSAPGLAVAGAALRGLGVPACIRQGTAAVERVLASRS